MLLVVAGIAVCLAIVVGIRNQLTESRHEAMTGLRNARVLLLASQSRPETIGSAEIWVNEKTAGFFEINGKEYREEDAKKLLTRTRLWLDQLQIDRIVYVDNEPGTTNGRNTTTSLVYSSGFVSVGGQTGATTFDDRRTLFQSKNILLETPKQNEN